MSLPTEQHFILKEDGKIYWIEKMPEEPLKPTSYDAQYQIDMGTYNVRLQSAIDSAVEVSNQIEVQHELWYQQTGGYKVINTWKSEATNKVHSLLCSVEKFTGKCKDICKYCRIHGCEISETVALVTFSKPEEKETQDFISGLRFKAQPNDKAETQEELFNDILDVLVHFNHYYKGKEMAQIIFKRIMQYYTITRNEL